MHIPIVPEALFPLFAESIILRGEHHEEISRRLADRYSPERSRRSGPCGLPNFGGGASTGPV